MKVMRMGRGGINCPGLKDDARKPVLKCIFLKSLIHFSPRFMIICVYLDSGVAFYQR